MFSDTRHLRYLIRTRPAALAGMVIVTMALTLAVVGPAVAPFDPTTAIPGDQLQPPSFRHLMGTDGNGMDVFSRVIASPRTDLTIAIFGTLGAIVIGIPLGLVAGYYRGFASELLMRVSDIVQSFPVFILGMALVVVTGQEIKNVVYVVAIVNFPIYVRLVRGQVLFLRERPFIEAARVLGARDRWLIREHIFPNAIGPVVANASITIGWAILLTAGLSFIGAGVRVPTPEWGSMIAVGAKNVYTGEWWPSVFPGIALAITVLGFALLGETMVQMTDSTRR
ncbi:MAG: peptide/nickel transport system permease protein [Chloroflexota bacterium]|jgi:peptide/nickel transport system permease protein|nr:peptide/nickel transport system permease protein [Chloroflexota bacterium]